jgi:hypothetical protein
MALADQAWAFVEPVWSWFMEGVGTYGPGAPNELSWMWLGVQIAAIALIMALMMRAWAAILAFVMIAVFTHVMADIVMPMAMEGAPFRAPPIAAMAYWQYLTFLIAAYTAAIGLLYLLKSAFSPSD